MWNGAGEGIVPRAAAELLGAGLNVQCMCLAVSDSRVVDTFGSPEPTEQCECYTRLKGAIAKNIEKRKVATPEDALQLASAGLYAAKCLSKQEPHHTVFVLSAKSRAAEAHHNPGSRGSITLVELAADSLTPTRTKTGRGDKTMIAMKGCLQAIGDATRLQRAIHVPFRDSKLTHIIQGVLSGTGPAALVCLCSIENQDTKDTMATLQFAQKTTPHRNKAKFLEPNSSTARNHTIVHPSPLSCGRVVARNVYPHDASTGCLSPIPRQAWEDNVVETEPDRGSPPPHSSFSSGHLEEWDITVNTRSRSPPSHFVTSALHESGGIGGSPQPYAVRLESGGLGRAIQAGRWRGHHQAESPSHEAPSSYHVWAASPPGNGYPSALLSPPSATPKPRRVPAHIGGAYDTAAAIQNKALERQNTDESVDWPGNRDKTTLNAWSLEVDSEHHRNSAPWDSSAPREEHAAQLSPTPPPRAEVPRRHSTPRRTVTPQQLRRSKRKSGVQSPGDKASPPARPQQEDLVEALLEEKFAHPSSSDSTEGIGGSTKGTPFDDVDAVDSYLDGNNTNSRLVGSPPLRISGSRRLFEFGSRSEDGDLIVRQHPRRKHAYDADLGT